MPHAPLLVCPAARAEEWAREHDPSHVIAVTSPDAIHHGRQAEEARSAVSKHAGPLERVLRDAPPALLSMTTEENPRGKLVIDEPNRVALAFHDIDAARRSLVPPREQDIAAILRFAETWDGARPLLIHCTLGISRSPAVAYAVACARSAPGREAELAARLRAASPCATPNPLIVTLADRQLGRGGRMEAAIANLGRGAEYEPQRGFALDLA